MFTQQQLMLNLHSKSHGDFAENALHLFLLSMYLSLFWSLIRFESKYNTRLRDLEFSS